MGFYGTSWFENVPWLHVYVGFSLAVELFEQYLNWRQLKRYYITQPPQKLKTLVSAEEFRKGNAYNQDKMKFGIFSSIFQSGFSLISTVYFLGPFLWRLTGKYLGSGNEYSHSLAYLGLNLVISELVSTGFQYYYDFVIEEKHGFNKKTKMLFWKDKFLGLSLTAAIGSPIICACIWLIKWGGENFYLWLWGFSVGISFIMMMVYPNLIAPLFNKFEPLKNEDLQEKIQKLADRLKFPLGKLYEMDGSKRSSHSNAYFYGMWWSKQIVLFDTLLHLDHDEILAILGHELGHWKLSHTLKMMCMGFGQLLCTFYLYGTVMNSDALFNSFGYTDTRATIIGLMLFSAIFSPVNTVIGFIMTLFSRKHEFEADAFSCGLGYDKSLREGLIHIHKENKSSLDPDPWYSWWHYSHPPLLERLQAIDDRETKVSKEE